MKLNPTLIAAVSACSFVGFMAGRISSEPNSGAPSQAGAAGGADSERITRRDGIPVGPRAAGQSSARDRTRSSAPSSSPQDPVARMEAIMAEANPLERTESWLRFVKDLDAGEIEEVVASFRAKDLARGHLSEYAMLLGAWAKQDPYAALDYASENTGTPFARQTILTSWATTDPMAAMEWAKSNHEGEEANPWMVGVIRGVAAANPALATELLTQMPYSRERGQALSAMQGHILKQGAEAARAWAMAIPDERLRAGATARIAESLARTDPKGTADWLLANPGEGSTRAIASVMASLAQSNPQQAMDYVQGIADEELRQSAFAGVSRELSSSDPQAAARLLEANPALATDDVREQFVWNAGREDPAMAAAAIQNIEDPSRQNRTYGRFLGRWLRDDSQAATQWMSQNPIPERVARMMEGRLERMQAPQR